MFKINTYDYNKKDFTQWEIESDYHCVYILENGKEAYIGETKDPQIRARQHNGNGKLNKKKYNFTKMHIITGELFEISSAKHYQYLLLKLMTADGKFNVVNRTGSERPHYARKNEFELHFDELWKKLETIGLVKNKEFKQIINASIYKYSPYTILTEHQNNALTSIIHTIDSGETTPHKKDFKTRPILIEGDVAKILKIKNDSLLYITKSREC